jgi:hypothetical protein
MPEVGAEDFPGNIFKVVRLDVKIVGVGVKVPNPRRGFGAFR